MQDLLNFLYLFYKRLSPGELSVYFYLVQLFISLIGGFIITYSHSFFGFSWLRSRLHFYVGIILPCIGLTITTVIGSNIALSLGMIGALSIVRFRTPVRSPYELVHYFSLLTVGIAAKTNLYIVSILILLLVALPHLLVFLYKTKIGEFFAFKSKKNTQDHIITLSFSGEKKYHELQKLLNNENVINFSINKRNETNLKFSGQAVFNNENLKKTFLSNYYELFDEYNLDREKTNNFF